MISIHPFGTCELGAVDAITVSNETISFTVLSYGATVQQILVKDRNGARRDVVLGYDTLEEYRKKGAYLGAAIGRFGNRIANARFSLNGQVYHLLANDHENHIHGGKIGFDKNIWAYETAENSVTFKTRLADGEEGYPGNMDVKITYSIDGDSGLRIDYAAVTDKDSPANFTNHSYFNLNGAGSGSVEVQMLQIDADAITAVDAGLIPTGELLDVTGTAMDFRQRKLIGRDIHDDFLKPTRGYDHNFCLNGSGLRKVAEAYAPDSGIRMAVETTMEGVQLYTANGMKSAGKGGKPYGDHEAFCLETQHYPDCVNHPEFPSCILKKGEELHETTIYRFSL